MKIGSKVIVAEHIFIKELVGKTGTIVAEKLPAIEMVRKATYNKIGRFTKRDIRELCPSLSLSSVEGALRKMVVTGELKREGTGKTTCYFRLK